MKKLTIQDYFIPEKRRLKYSQGGPLGMGWIGFIAPELAQFVYGLFTVLVILFTWTNLPDPTTLLWQRITALTGTLLLWFVYQLWPCRAMMIARVGYLLFMLGVWYPDTYEINKQFGSLDHHFAIFEQSVFGAQPALLFSEKFSSKIVSELMYMGYESYYLFFVVFIVIVAIKNYSMLERATYILFASFFVCYAIYIFLPVTGPQYYFHAVGIEHIRMGGFPDIGHYFADSTECLTAPGWADGIFYKMCQAAHNTGERPTAAFPSSHVAVATLVMAMAAKMKYWKYMLILAVPYLFLCMATVYIRAHYAIDAIAGFFFGIALFFIFGGMKLKAERS